MELEIDKMYNWCCPHCGPFEDYPLAHDSEYAICPSCGMLIHRNEGAKDEEDYME